MKQIASENEARLTELKRELVKSVVQSRYWNSKTSTYAAPTRAIPHRVKKLIADIETLEKEIGLRPAEGPKLKWRSKWHRKSE